MWGQAAAKEPPIDYHEPEPDPSGIGALSAPESGHLPGVVPDRLIGPGPYQHLPSLDETGWVVAAVRDQPFWKAGVADPVLTSACQLGDFASLPVNRIVVRFTGKGGRALLQVVAPHYRHLLVDRRKLARPGEIYYFHDAGLPTCQVWVEGGGPAHSFPKGRNTVLPPPNRNAVKDRRAEINSWPK